MTYAYNPGPRFTRNSSYGKRVDPFTGIQGTFHSGQDFRASAGTPIPAATPGTVIYSGFNKNLGNVVIVRNEAGGYSLYGHMLDGNRAEIGQRVWPGDIVGLVGSTGARTTGPHLHYSVITDEAGERITKEGSGPIGILLKEKNNTIDPDRYEPKPRYLDETLSAVKIMLGASASSTPAAPPLDRRDSFDDRFGRWGSSPAGIAPASVSDDPTSFDRRFSTWGSAPSVVRVRDRQGSYDDRTGNPELPAEEVDRVRSPVLRELQRYRQLAAAVVAAAPSSAASHPGIPLASSAVGNEAGGPSGGVLKWIGNSLMGSAEASQPRLLRRDAAASDFVGENDGPLSNANEAASPLAPDNRRYLVRRIAGQPSAFDTGAPAVPFISTNAGLAPDHPNSFDDRFGNWPSASGVTESAPPQQASRPLGIFTGEPMPDLASQPRMFVLPDKSDTLNGDDWFKFFAGLVR